jgi:hypothetical protein
VLLSLSTVAVTADQISASDRKVYALFGQIRCINKS